MPQWVEGTSLKGERPFATQTTFDVSVRAGAGAARAGKGEGQGEAQADCFLDSHFICNPP